MDLIKSKINEYISLLEECGFVTDYRHLEYIKQKLNSIKVKRIFNVPGDATINGNTLSICYENIENNIKVYGESYIDEVLFHEFSHFINSFHNSIYGNESFIIRDYLERKMSDFTTAELLEQADELLYNQDPCFGIVLLDEFIAQSISQILVLKKLSKFNDYNIKKYTNDKNMKSYKLRYQKTYICEPPMTLETSLADYPEFYAFAKKFISKYSIYDINSFIKKSLTPDFLKKILNNLNSEEIEKIYIDLCYLGIIQQRVYLLKKLIKIEDKNDPAYEPRKVYKAMSKILKRSY